MRIGQDVLIHMDAALAREWLLTNGLGGSSSGTIAGCGTRRTHGLLVAAGPHGRLTTLLLKLDERLKIEASDFELSPPLQAGSKHARPLLVEEFRLDPWPTWRIRAGEVLLEKSVFMVEGHNAVVAAWRHLGGPDATLTVSPLVVARDPESLQHETTDLAGTTQGVPGRVRIVTTDDRPALTLWHNGVFMPARLWQRRLVYPMDALPDATGEDALVPGHIKTPLSEGGTLHLVAAAEDDLFRALAAEERLGVPPPRTLAECVAALENDERARALAWEHVALEGADSTARQAAAAHGAGGDGVSRRLEPLVDAHDVYVLPLTRAIHAGLARRGRRLTLIDSFPAGGERPEAALRALPALIALRGFDAARAVLRGYLEYLDEGLIPDAFDRDDGRPLYGDPAPSLWLIHAAELFVRRSGDQRFLEAPLFAGLEQIMTAYRSGTRHGIRVEPDGLLSAGEGASAARRADLNALWYHALVAMAQLARLIGRKESGAFYLAWAREHQKQFNDTFWDEERGCLFHAISAHGPSPGLLPSHLLAVSLSPSLLPAERAERLIETVERELKTPHGLREAPGIERIAASWTGAWAGALLRARQRSPESQREAVESLLALHRASEPLLGHMPSALVLAPEPGGEPGTAGCEPASILVAAEALRVWIEEVDRSESWVGVSPLASSSN